MSDRNLTKDNRPEGLYNADGEATYMSGYANNDFGQISINGTVYQIQSWGYVCGRTNATLVLSQFSVLFSKDINGGTRYCNVCPVCWHNCGDKRCPDWSVCGTQTGDFGFLVKFKAAWRAHCLRLLRYTPVMGQVQLP